MGNALEEFRAQREAVEYVRARLLEVVGLLQSIRQETGALVHDQVFRNLLDEEQTWLLRAQDLVRQVQRFREAETSRFWPAVWRRWAAAVVLVLAAGVAAGIGYTWVGRPYERELVDLRERVELLDFVAQRVITMTPSERQQFDALMGWDELSKR
jgi:hypothetical protein